MISQDLNNNVKLIEAEFAEYYSMSRDALFTRCLQERLQASLTTYQDALDETTNYLARQRVNRVMKSLLRIQKNNDKDVILANLKKEQEEGDEE